MATTLLIRGVSVCFPFSPYPAQVEYMTTVIDALSSSSRALLESPTGTGKTLCMLCACIAWVQHQRRLDCGLDLALNSRSGAQSSRRGRSKKDVGIMEGPTRRPLRILYTSRTHAQLAQVVRELRKTEYREIKMAVLGSREHLCIHPNVSRSTGGSQAMTTACNHLREEQNCRFFKRIQHNLSNTRFLEALSGAGSATSAADSSSGGGGVALPDSTEYLGRSSGVANESDLTASRDRVPLPAAHDIEDLCKSGRSAGFCPYFYERSMAREADLVLLPYTYLFDPQVRRQLPVSLEDAIVIIDEAHNLPAVLSASSNVALEPVDVSNAIREVAVAINFLHSDAQANRDNMSAADAAQMELTVERLSTLRVALHDLEEAIHLAGQSEGSTLPPGSAIVDFSRNPAVATDPIAAANAPLERVFKGSAVFELLRACGWTRSMWLGDGPLEEYGGGGNAASRATADSFSGAVSEAVAALANSETGSPGLAVVQQFLDHVYLSDASAAEMDEYCRLVLLGSVKGASASGRGRGQGVPRIASGAAGPVPPNQRAWSVGFWTLEASVAMHRAVDGVKGLLLTSGTLSPLEHFAAEIGLSFPFALAGKHVIEPSQVLCCVMSRGPDGRALNGSHAFRGSDSYKMSLGFALLNISRSVPNGMLVFFSSYSAMHGAVDLWKMGSSTGDQTTTLWGQLSVLKTLFVEPMDSGELKAVIAAFQKQADMEDHGAILFAVCRGKVSEGIDFADRHGRCVVVAGIPYANQTDLFVRLKRQYLTNVAPSRPKVQRKLFTGDDWYRQEAMRTVNQAIGRVIRHKDDFGAVVLADERFAQQREWLPQWLRPSYVAHPSFRECYAALGTFFEARRPSRRHRPRSTGATANHDDDDAVDEGEMEGSLATLRSVSTTAETPFLRGTAPLRAELAATHLEQTLDEQKRRAEEEKRMKHLAKQADGSDASDAVTTGGAEVVPRRRPRLFAKQQVVVVVAPPTQQQEEPRRLDAKHTCASTTAALEATNNSVTSMPTPPPPLPQNQQQDAKLRLVQLLRSKLVPSAYDAFREQLVRLVTLTKQLRVSTAEGKEALPPPATGTTLAAQDTAKQDLRHEFRRLVSDVESLFRAHISVEKDVKDSIEAFHACLPQQFRPVTALSKRPRSPPQC